MGESYTMLGTRSSTLNPILAYHGVNRSIEFTGPVTGNQKGDLRMAARFDIPANYFSWRDPARYATNASAVHGIQSGWGDGVGTGVAGYVGGGKFPKNGVIRANKPPILPVEVNGVKLVTGKPAPIKNGDKVSLGTVHLVFRI